MFIRVGEVLKELRKQCGISQEELAGLIDRSNLSRIERGKQAISRVQLEVYLDKLGYDITYFLHHALDDTEFRVYALRDELDNHMINFDYVKAKETIAKIEAFPHSDYFDKGPHLQFLLKNKAQLIMYEDPQEAYNMLREAIHLAIHDFDETLVESYLLARNDIEVITTLAITTHLLGDTDKAISIINSLANNIRSRGISTYEKARSLTLILYNLAVFLGSMKRYQEMLDVCDEAIIQGQENRCYGLLPMLIYNKAYSLFYLDQKSEVIVLLRDAYHTCRAFGHYEYANNIKAKAKENFNINL